MRLSFGLRGAMLAAALALSTPAPAADAPKLTLQQCGDILTALTALSDGRYQAVDKAGQPVIDKAGNAVMLPYRLGGQRMTIALNMDVLRGVVQAGDQARVGLVREILPNGTPPVGTPEFAKFQASDPAYKRFLDEYQKLLDAPQGVVPGRLKLADLDVGDAPDHNPIPPTVLQPLLPIIER